MFTKIYKYEKLTINDYKELSTSLQQGSIMVYPTETIYGIGCNAMDENAINRIIKIKQRPLSKNFINIFKDINMLKQYVDITNKKELELIEKYWPGALTIILKKKNFTETIACRISPHPFIKKLFNFLNFPLISTSANISNEEYCGEIEKIIGTFNKKVDIIIDSGNLIDNIASTIVKVERNNIRVIRQGIIRIHK